MDKADARIPDDYRLDENIAGKLSEMLSCAEDAGGKLGLPKGFLDDLIKELSSENDWSFIIKVHALTESIINHTLTEKICIKDASFDWKKEERSDFFTRLPIGGRSGKAAFAERLGIIPKGLSRFAMKLSEIRNFYVHDLKNMNVKVESFVCEINRSCKQDFYMAFFPGYEEKRDFVLGLPQKSIKLLIFMQVCVYLSTAHAMLKPPRSYLKKLLDSATESDSDALLEQKAERA